MKNLRRDKGVTLVALVVTIVVMLILAGVSISTLSGENGFLTKSKEIKSNIEQAEAEGQQRINTLKSEQVYDSSQEVEILNDDEAPTINSMEVTDITANSFKVSVNVTETGSGLAKIEYSIDDGEHYITPENNQAKSYTFTDLKVYLEEYKVKVKVTDVNNNSSYVTKTIEKLKIGDYVNYTYDTAKNYVLTEATCGSSSNPTDGIAQTTGLKWRILNINDDGSLDLISATPTSAYVYLSGALGYNNGVYLLNDICEKQYSNSSLGITGRSINLEDTEKHLTETGLATRNARNNGTLTYGDTKTYTSSSYRKYPLLWARQNGSGLDLDLTSLDTTATNYQDLVRAKLKTDGISESDAYYSEPTTTETSTTAGTQITVQQTGYYNITFNSTNYGEAGAVLNSSSYYWVASRGADSYSKFAIFGFPRAKACLDIYGLFRSDGYDEADIVSRLRPLVSLDSSLLTGTKTNGAWNLQTSK